MNALAFLIAAAGFIVMSAFVFFSYPRAWRENRVFTFLLGLWHLTGVSCLIAVFTVYMRIRHEGLRHEISRVATIYYIGLMLLALMFLIRLVSSTMYRFIARQTGVEIPLVPRYRVSDKKVHALIFTAIAYTVSLVGYFNIDVLYRTDYEVHIVKASSMNQLDICLIADIHAGSGTWESSYDDLSERIREISPDVLLIAGDVFDETSSEKDIEYVLRSLEKAGIPEYGSYFIYGNHDNPIERELAQKLKEVGVVILEDEMITIGEDIQLLGLLDFKQRRVNSAKVIESLHPDLNKPLLLLTHRPLGFQKIADTGVDLVMAGHTHGFNIPQFLGTPMFSDMFYGKKEYGKMTAIVTSGVSAWGFHYKWPATSEVVHIRLTFGK